jgi:hypothetical protein
VIWPRISKFTNRNIWNRKEFQEQNELTGQVWQYPTHATRDQIRPLFEKLPFEGLAMLEDEQSHISWGYATWHLSTAISGTGSALGIMAFV